MHITVSSLKKSTVNLYTKSLETYINTQYATGESKYIL
jgi:hypothetical protein